MDAGTERDSWNCEAIRVSLAVALALTVDQPPLSTRVPIRSLGHRPFVRIASPRRMDADRYAAPPFPRTARAGAFGCSRPRRARRAPLARRDVRTIAARSDRAMRRSPALCCPGRGHLIAAREERGAVAPLLGRARVTR